MVVILAGKALDSLSHILCRASADMETVNVTGIRNAHRDHGSAKTSCSQSEKELEITLANRLWFDNDLPENIRC
uniref:Uncharacterized protein n=1 Tax=Haemonchus placei TaxID=6290 RepID=A0A0N4W371_HAEPC